MSESAKPEKSRHVKDRYGGGPHGLGDPDDLFLRKIELDVLISKKVREKSRQEKCVEEVKAFSECAAETGLLMVVKCRKESDVLKECLGKWFYDEKLREECKNEYLAERSEYRRTGINKKAQERAKVAGANRVQPTN